jgi:hypothetical protein
MTLVLLQTLRGHHVGVTGDMTLKKYKDGKMFIPSVMKIHQFIQTVLEERVARTGHTDANTPLVTHLHAHKLERSLYSRFMCQI